MERNVEQLAWTVLIAAFAALCLLVAAVATGKNWYLAQAEADRPVQLDVIQGTTLWLPAGGRQEVNAAGRIALTGGEQVRTSADSEALLSFFDGSNVRLWPNTTIHLLQTKSSAYRNANSEFVLVQDTGHARFEVAIPATISRRFEVQTPQGSALLREGSYKVEVTDDVTQVSVSSGSATVSGGLGAVEVLKGEWTGVKAQGSPSRPESDIHNLIVNGDFGQGLEGWQPGNRDLDADVPGTVLARSEGFRTFLELARDQGQRHAETFLHKAIAQDVTDFGLLKLSFQLRLLTQKFTPAGLGSELPLIVRIHYRDSTGSEATWSRGFYLPEPDARPPRDAAAVITGLWTDEVFDLFDPNTVTPRPAEIMWIEFASSGLAYQSDIGNVQILVD